MKRIYHVGGWHRNYGDFALQLGEMRMLRAASEESLEFIPINCQTTRFHRDLITLINDDADLLLVGGGGMVFHRPEDDSQSGWQFNISQEDLERLTVPLVVYGIGFNKFYFDDRGFKPQMNEHLQATQAKAALFSVRNQGTFDELVSRGLSAERMEVIPDPGMFAPTAPLSLPGLTEGDFKIGLNWAGDRNFYRFPEPWEETRLQVVDALCEALKRLLDRQGGGRVVFIPHLAENIDSEVAPLFEERLGAAFYNVEEELPFLYPASQAQLPLFADIYRQMDLVVGMRGHSNIVPFGLGTRVIGLGSHNKNRFFLEQIGESQAMINTQNFPSGCSAEEMLATMTAVVDDDSLEARQAERLAALTAVSDSFNRRVVGLLA
ncbi:polysaccharide pyruvyl transferase family protein [Pelagibius sp.]|uniref:polysaccharide pyruvyl transferase family protein n=1 Tax=Pelagibius sp. TaxID=1931238 RepID=UPI002612340E|nr:polysaccharide pyruvyl transferase family protein [Pelagibius sp.]